MTRCYMFVWYRGNHHIYQRSLNKFKQQMASSRIWLHVFVGGTTVDCTSASRNLDDLDFRYSPYFRNTNPCNHSLSRNLCLYIYVCVYVCMGQVRSSHWVPQNFDLKIGVPSWVFKKMTPHLRYSSLV